MTGFTPEQEQRLAALAARKAAIDERARHILVATKEAMREAGHPVREDYASRAAYRTAMARFRRGVTAA